MKTLKHLRELMADLELLGATDIHVEHGGRHPKLFWTLAGKVYSQSVPSTPSDGYRWRRNALSEIRRRSMGPTS